MKITLVTPSFNQSLFLERTILSVLGQNYPNIEYVVADGGSTDGSVDIIRRYADRLSWWVSEKDMGQSHAINKGLRRATGDIVGWLNSDDTLAPGALHAIAQAYQQHPEADLIYGHTCLIDQNDRILRRLCAVPTNASELINFNPNMFSQPGTTWRTSLNAKIGYLDEALHYAMDCDFWIRAAQHGVLRLLPRHLANLRCHGATKSERLRDVRVAEYAELKRRYGALELGRIRRLALTARRYSRILASPPTLAYRLGLSI